MSVSASACTAAESETYGGQTTTSTSPRSSSRSARQNSAASARPLEHLPVAGDQHRAYADGIAATPGKLLALEQLERGAAAGRDPGDAVGDAGLVDRAHGVAAADDREAVAVGHGARDGERALGEARPFEDAHRPVPEDGLRVGDRGRELLARLGPDVEAEPAVGRVVVGRDRASRRRRRTSRRRRRRVGSSTSNGNGFSARTSSAIFPPISTRSAREPRFFSTPTLSATLAPPDTITNGRSTSPSSAPRFSSSASSSRPAYEGSRCATPSVEACARCAEPNASLT